jgi:hypothetical protein
VHKLRTELSSGLRLSCSWPSWPALCRAGSKPATRKTVSGTRGKQHAVRIEIPVTDALRQRVSHARRLRPPGVQNPHASRSSGLPGRKRGAPVETLAARAVRTSRSRIAAGKPPVAASTRAETCPRGGVMRSRIVAGRTPAAAVARTQAWAGTGMRGLTAAGPPAPRTIREPACGRPETRTAPRPTLTHGPALRSARTAVAVSRLLRGPG